MPIWKGERIVTQAEREGQVGGGYLLYGIQNPCQLQMSDDICKGIHPSLLPGPAEIEWHAEGKGASCKQGAAWEECPAGSVAHKQEHA